MCFGSVSENTKHGGALCVPRVACELFVEACVQRRRVACGETPLWRPIRLSMHSRVRSQYANQISP